MKKYLLVETRSTWDSQNVSELLNLSLQLKDKGHEVIVVFIQNAVIMLKKNVEHSLQMLLNSNVQLWADDFSLSHRNLSHTNLIDDVTICNMEMIVTKITNPEYKSIWH